MQTKAKGIIWSVVIIAVFLGALAVAYFGLQLPVFDRTGWHTVDEETVVYRDYFGRRTVGWATLEGEKYYFDEQGVLQTGWIETGEERYYLNSKGTVYTGWLKSDGQYYYLAQDGKMQTGWLNTEKGRYYLHEDGVMHISWLDTADGRYFFNVDGTMYTGWLYTQDGTYLLTDEGTAYTGWYTTPQCRYYMDETGRVATGFVTVNGTECYFLPSGEYVPLVNGLNPLSDDYEPQLTEVEGFQVDMTCRDGLVELVQACRDAGFRCTFNSAYRDEEHQQAVWDEYMQIYMSEGSSFAQAEERTAKYVAVPGTSEHHLGLAIDFTFEEGIYDWLEDHAWEYGFILRYPEDVEGVEYVTYEPWHYRYLGNPLATKVHESGLMLEQYLETLR